MKLNPNRAGRRTLTTAVGCATLLVGLTAISAPPVQATVLCAVQYQRASWPGGMSVNIVLGNVGDTWTGWTLRFAFPDVGERIAQGWSATWTQRGRDVTVTNMPWNGTVTSGGTAVMGFNGTWTTSAAAPVSFSVNGVACTRPGTTTTTVSSTTTTRTTTRTTPTTTRTTTTTTTTTPPTTGHVDNPYAGARAYVNPDWSAKAAADGGSAVAGQPTAVWLDSVAAVTAEPGSGYPTSLRGHLDNALAQGAGLVQVVIYDLPGRNCGRLWSDGELFPTELDRYRNDFIDPIASIEADPRYASLRIVNIIEPDSLVNLITSVSYGNERCVEVQSDGTYLLGVRYALDALHAAGPNVYTYVDVANHSWFGWETNFAAAATLFAQVAKDTAGGVNSVDGFVTNTANYAPTTEPYFTIDTMVGGVSVRRSRWVEWNNYVDELTFAQAFRRQLVANGFDPSVGMLLDTSRNGWGGSLRPKGPSISNDVDTFVDESRIDRRIHAGDWCNQAGAGLGARPVADPAPGIDAYVWIKPPGESDGSSALIPIGVDNPMGKGFDRMCDPDYGGNYRNGNNPSGALADAPPAGAWFSAQFHELLANAYPPL
ncbi:MAG: cellulose 1,4-beta-cellobiosidase [Actinomycetales bacterium]|nr:cellulose 1,4-beta-cellobiosidase [Actinomycetales bacterium]